MQALEAIMALFDTLYKASKREKAIQSAIEFLKKNYDINLSDLERQKQFNAAFLIGLSPNGFEFNDQKFLKYCEFAMTSKTPFNIVRDVCIDWLNSDKDLPEPVRKWISGYMSREIAEPKKQGKQKDLLKLFCLSCAAFIVHQEHGYNFDKNAASTHNNYAYAIVAEAATRYGMKGITDNTVRTAGKLYASKMKNV
jgi:hypothetical protein